LGFSNELGIKKLIGSNPGHLAEIKKKEKSNILFKRKQQK